MKSSVIRQWLCYCADYYIVAQLWNGCLHACVLATPFDIFSQISYIGLLGLSNVHLGERLLIRHIVSQWWCMGGFSEAAYIYEWFKIGLN